MSSFKKVAFIMILSCGFSSQMSIAAEDTKMPTPVAKVVWVKGTLKATMENKEERLLKKSSIVYLKDTLNTSDKSQAEIVFTDASLMTFGSDTTFRVDEYEYRPKDKGSSAGKFVMSLIEGGFRTITGAIGKKDPTAYEVRTPVATIGVRGTDYAVQVDKKGQLYMNHYSGSACVTSSGKTICADNKNKYAFVASKGAPPIYLDKQPEIFTQQLEIVPAKFSIQGGTLKGGMMNSFCIQ